MRNTQKKGDTAVARAIATFTSHGFDVSIPLTESAPYDLIIDTGESLKKIQVKFSSDGKEIGLRRIHSNSQGYVIKRFQEKAFDWLYILNGRGEEFLVLRNLANRSTITPRASDKVSSVISSFRA